MILCQKKVDRVYSTWFEKHFYSAHMWFPLEKSRHFIQRGLLPHPFSFQTLAIFPIGCLKSLSFIFLFFLKEVKIFFSLQGKNSSNVHRQNYPEKPIPWANTKYEKICNLLSILNYTALKNVRKIYQSRLKKYPKRQSVPFSDIQNEKAVTSTTDLHMYV